MDRGQAQRLPSRVAAGRARIGGINGVRRRRCDFEAYAASDIECLIARVRGLQTAIIATAGLREAASDVAARATQQATRKPEEIGVGAPVTQWSKLVATRPSQPRSRRRPNKSP